MNSVGGRPKSKYRGGDNCRRDPRLALVVKLCAEKKPDRGQSVYPAAERSFERSFGNPWPQSRAKIMQRIEDPPEGPDEQIGLTLDGVDICEETGYESGSREQGKHDKILMYQGCGRFFTRTSSSAWNAVVPNSYTARSCASLSGTWH